MMTASSMRSERWARVEPKLEKDSMATRGTTPNRRATFAVWTAISASVRLSGYTFTVASARKIVRPLTFIM